MRHLLAFGVSLLLLAPLEAGDRKDKKAASSVPTRGTAENGPDVKKDVASLTTNISWQTSLVQAKETARKEGVLQILLDAGAEILPNSCGICAGYGEHVLGDDVVAISSTARNFKGRMGSAAAQVYLASPYTVAASAVAGRIADPREMLQ